MTQCKRQRFHGRYQGLGFRDTAVGDRIRPRLCRQKGNSTGTAREYFWAGAAGTGFYVDPKEQVICILMTQAMPGMQRRYDRYLFKQLVYQAITD